MFRDLAATGRSRTALFLSRVGGAWVIVTVLVAITLAVDFAGAFVLADGTPTPHLGDLGTAFAMVLTSGLLGAALAVGIAALVGSRGPVIAILLAMHLIFEPQLQGAGFLGDARQALPISAINRIGDQAKDLDYTLALGTSVGVVIAWAVAALAAGAWRTRTPGDLGSARVPSEVAAQAVAPRAGHRADAASSSSSSCPARSRRRTRATSGWWRRSPSSPPCRCSSAGAGRT